MGAAGWCPLTGRLPGSANARVSKKITWSRGRRRERLVLFDVEPAEAASVLRRYVAQVAITRPSFDVTRESSLDAFAGEAARHPVFLLVREDE